ncbi:MAG: thioredoxin family protein [Promethearchaeota archaeon]
MVEQLEDEKLDEYVKNHDIVILDIFTTWCGPCITQAAILEELAKDKVASNVSIVKMDADTCPKTCGRFNITAIPTVVLFNGGQHVKIHVGVWSKEDLLKEIAALK